MMQSILESLLFLSGCIAAGGVVVGAVCRVDKMGWRKTKLSYFLVYVGLAAWAMGIGIDLVRSVFIDWYTYAGLFSAFGHFLLTMKEWKHGPPDDVKTQPGSLE